LLLEKSAFQLILLILWFIVYYKISSEIKLVLRGGCRILQGPIHLKGAPEVERRRRRGSGVWGGGCGKFWYFLYHII